MKKSLLFALPAAVMLLAVSFVMLVPSTNAALFSASWPGCGAFKTQPEAQAAWVKAGKPRIGDADGDGKACETLPAGSSSGGGGTTQTGNCKLTNSVANIKLSGRKYPGTTKHLQDAIKKGKPRVMHLARSLADAHRAASLAGIPTKKGYDRDEYPMAASREGGKGADVRYVLSADNRGAGSVVGAALRPYCDGQAFQIVVTS